MKNTVLFICTGNYYRSRFAEAMFNFYAEKYHSSWSAFSRGLAVHLVNGAISSFARQELQRRGVDLSYTSPFPIGLTTRDLQWAGRVIAMYEEEHRPMMEIKFPQWANAIEYWQVADLDEASAEEALSLVDRLVQNLVQKLAVDAKREHHGKAGTDLALR